MDHLLFVLSVAVPALAFALLEIQIEGASGWASNLPTWRVDNRWTRLLMGSRALTGYHLYAHLFLLTLVHLPFGLSLLPFSWSAELRLLAFLILFWIVEDFLWFVFNPAYRVRGFSQTAAWWHARSWWGFMPREYWIFTPIGIAFYLASLPH